MSSPKLRSLAEAMLDRQIPPLMLRGEVLSGSRRLGSALDDCLEPLLECFQKAIDSEIDDIHSAIHPVYHLFYDLDGVKSRVMDEVRQMAACWLEFLVNEEKSSGTLSLFTPIQNSRVSKRFPELSQYTDEGLIELRHPLSFDSRGLIMDGQVVHFHPCLGAGSGAPQSGLLAWLVDHANKCENKVKVAIDPRCYTPSEEFQPLIQKDYWWGVPFRRSDLEDPHMTGVTVHVAPARETAPQTFATCLLAGINRTEFFWKSKEGIKTLAAEEVVNPGRSPGRFLHAEYVVSEGYFRHLDGAIMIYSEGDRSKRSEQNCVLPRTPRADHKPKLFRIDGSLSTDDWSRLMSLFFRGNPLVHEYLAGSTGASIDVAQS